MKTIDEEKEGLDYLQQKAVKNAIRENKALKLSYRTIENGQLVQVTPDGHKMIVGNAKYGTVKVKQKSIKLKK